MKNKRFLTGLLMLVVLVISMSTGAYASAPTDEILNYEITLDVNSDATVNITYTIDWKVLDDSIGKVEWLEVGIPNSHYSNITGLSDNISKVDYYYDSGYYIRIDFDKSYAEDEIIHFSYSVTMDYMYAVNEKIDGQTLYSFTPGWFNEVAVDNLVIKWNCDSVESIYPAANIIDGYYTWESSLAAGEKYEVQVSYLNSAYSFDETKSYIDSGSSNDDFDFVDALIALVAVPFIIVVCFVPFVVPIIVIIAVFKGFKNGAGFNSGTTTKVTRTIVEYYPSCQGCGAPREEGKKFCEYCGRSMVKSEQTIKEEKVPEDKKDILKYKTNGTYRYSSNPNTYVVVNTVHVPRPRPSGSSSSSTRSHSSCAHSSCAHSSCACACACACAGGGRAGCSNKDFYNTNLKLKYLSKRKK